MQTLNLTEESVKDLMEIGINRNMACFDSDAEIGKITSLLICCLNNLMYDNKLGLHGKIPTHYLVSGDVDIDRRLLHVGSIVVRFDDGFLEKLYVNSPDVKKPFVYNKEKVVIGYNEYSGEVVLGIF